MKPYRKYFRQCVVKNYPGTVELLISAIENEYAHIQPDIDFARKSANPMERRLDIAAYFLAFIMVLKQRNEKYETIKKLCVDIATEYVRPKNKWQLFLKRLPVKIIQTPFAVWFSKRLNDKISRLAHPGSFVANIITDKKETFGLGYGVNILECGICKLYKKHDCGQFASILCEVDYITTNIAGLKMIRSGTIANGAKICDFRYQLR